MSNQDVNPLVITHDAAESRFSATYADTAEVGYLTYELDDSEGEFVSMATTHTVVKPEFAGRGIAGQLTERALEMAVAQAWSVEPVCSYVAGYIAKHPKYADLVAS